MIEDKPEVRTFTDVEAAWLAGVIDGEGSFGLYNYGKEGRRVIIQMGNTSEAFVGRFKEIIGGCGSTVHRMNMGESHKGRKPMYHYILKGSARCYKVLKQVLPYLIIKKEKALDIIKELESAPFGRWKNATPEYRRRQSERIKKEWQNPEIRAKRLEGMRRAKNVK